MNLRKSCWTISAKALVLTAFTLFATCSGLLSSLAVAQPAGESESPKPMVLIALSGYDALMEDIDFIGSMGGEKGLAQNIEQMLMLFTQNQGLAGLEKDKPLGLVVQSDGMNIGGALCIPVTSLEELTTTLAPFGVTTEDLGEGITEITASGQTLFAREKNGWAFLSMMPQMLENLPEDPEQLFGTLAKEYDLGVQVHVQNIPEPFRQMAIDQLQKGMEGNMQQLPDESEEKFEARKEMTTAQIDQLKQAINEVDELTVGLKLDSEQQRAYFDFIYTAVPGTQLADQAEQNSDPKTNFAGFFQPDAVMLSFASKISEADVAQMDQMVDAVRKQAQAVIEEYVDLPSDETREVVKSAIDDFMDAFKATMEAGVMDGGVVLNMAPNSLTLVAGGFIGDPSKIESGLKKLAELGKEEPKFSGIHWNSDSHGDINFHTLSVPIPEDKEEPRQLFGDTLEVVVGIGKESVFFALGHDYLDALKGVIDASAADPQKSVPPMEMTFALGQIMESTFADEEKRATLESIANILANEANGRDHVKIVAQPIPLGARTRVELEEGVLRAIGEGVNQARAQGVGSADF
ncbi:MAG: hypothetical protein GXP28_10170 [Planctomycetes bacterium]|nr:hypothetical protein [Planctomycetota bacterium]